MFDLDADLATRKASGLYRQRRINSAPQGVHSIIDGQKLLSFCSNDYLGLANHSAVKKAFQQAVDDWGVGSGSAHLINGHSKVHEECEERLAAFTGRDRALLFSTGYMANLAITSALLDRHDTVYQDRLNHASLIDAAKITDARLRRYRHNDLQHLDELLKQDQDKGSRLVMTDGVFSMDGDCVDLNQYAQTALKYGAMTMVDDAHGFGVLGESGAGITEQQAANQDQIHILMATLGKAVGTAGAFVAGSESFIETLIQKSRPYIFTTAMPSAIAAATIASLAIVETECWRREKLGQLINHLRMRMSALPLTLMPSNTAIQPVVIGDNHRCLHFSAALREAGIDVVAIRPPTVPDKTARLRITLSAMHEEEHIDLLVDQLSIIIEAES